ncbi:microfibril-associated glycoprotein 4 [Drosophila rhopaloa]|uniref:Microfibril-associated glycoprotein 4 n=1 Tax=Drosophila rhopaloa TaxID=1041015 RepID=A0A6P4F8H1_DRORH|nr:microfibril-associated glycoprotein 4 [Drosophila rhopaloa]
MFNRMHSSFVVFFVWFLFPRDHSLGSAENNFPQSGSNQILVAQCNGYCDELNNKIRSLEDTVKELQSRLENSKSQTNLGENLSDTCPSGSPSGMYQMKVPGVEPFQVTQCKSAAAGWTVIQRRLDGSVSFNQSWTNYKNGFGNERGEFFIGLQKLHLMTAEQPHDLFIQLKHFNGDTVYAHFDDFKVGSEKELYKLERLGQFSGTAGDSLKYHKDKKFSTFDNDNDDSRKNCAAEHGGGWWYHNCLSSSLNGLYFKEGETYTLNGIHWGNWKYYSFTFVQMMIRPKFF